MDRPRIKVDFNEMVESNVVLLSKTDEVTDSDGKAILLEQGKRVFVYEYNMYQDGQEECLVADGIAEQNDARKYGEWTKTAKWCCRIDERGIRNT